MNKGLSPLLTVILGLLIIGIVGGSFYVGTLFKTNNSVVVPANQEKITPLVGGDRDIHGCIGSAGYSWCEAKQKCLRTWEEPCTISTTTPAIDETKILTEAIKQAVVAKRGSSANDLTFTVSKVMGNYAQGGASGQGGGGMWFAAKVNGIWTLVWDGNGIILCSDITNYPDYPKTMVPECYNDKTDTMVKR